LLWDVLYDPAGRAIRLLGGGNGKNVVDGVYHFGQDTAVQMGSFIAKVPWLTEWSEIHVVRHRHLVLAYIGLGIMVIGVLMRLVFRPQRVWLEETTDGCRVWAVGGVAKKLLSTLNKKPDAAYKKY
jgi:cytochrome c biogenesis protein ResB